MTDPIELPNSPPNLSKFLHGALCYCQNAFQKFCRQLRSPKQGKSKDVCSLHEDQKFQIESTIDSSDTNYASASPQESFEYPYDEEERGFVMTPFIYAEVKNDAYEESSLSTLSQMATISEKIVEEPQAELKQKKNEIAGSNRVDDNDDFLQQNGLDDSELEESDYSLMVVESPLEKQGDSLSQKRTCLPGKTKSQDSDSEYDESPNSGSLPTADTGSETNDFEIPPPQNPFKDIHLQNNNMNSNSKMLDKKKRTVTKTIVQKQQKTDSKPSKKRHERNYQSVFATGIGDMINAGKIGKFIESWGLTKSDVIAAMKKRFGKGKKKGQKLEAPVMRKTMRKVIDEFFKKKNYEYWVDKEYKPRGRVAEGETMESDSKENEEKKQVYLSKKVCLEVKFINLFEKASEDNENT